MCSIFGLIRFVEIMSWLPKLLLLSTFIIGNLILFVESCLADLSEPCSKLFRHYRQVYHKEKTLCAMLKSLTPLRLNLGSNFAYPRKYLYLVLMFRLSRFLNTMLASYPASRVVCENVIKYVEE